MEAEAENFYERGDLVDMAIAEIPTPGHGNVPVAEQGENASIKAGPVDIAKTVAGTIKDMIYLYIIW